MHQSPHIFYVVTLPFFRRRESGQRSRRVSARLGVDRGVAAVL